MDYIFGGFIFIISLVFIYILATTYFTFRLKITNHPTFKHSLFMLDTAITTNQDGFIKRVAKIKKESEITTEKYSTDINNLLNSSCKEILGYMSAEVKEHLLSHFSNDGLIKYIKSKLKSFI